MELRAATEGSWRRTAVDGSRSPVVTALLLVAIVGGALVVGKLTASRPLEMAGVMGFGVVAVGALLRPNVSTYAVLFLLYSNAVGVAVSLHGVPRMSGALFPLLLCIPIGHALFIQRRGLVVTRDFTILLAFFCVQCVSLLFARYPAIAWKALEGYAFEGVVLYFLVTNAVRTKDTLRYAIWALVAAGFVMSAPALLQQVTGTFDTSYGGFAQVDGGGFDVGGPSRQPRLAGPIGEKNFYSQCMLMLLPLCFYLYWSERSKALRATALGIGMLVAAGFTLAFSRGGGVGAAAVIAFMVALRMIDARRLVAIGAGVFLLLLAFPQYWQRMATLGTAGHLFSKEITREEAPDGAIRRRATEMMAAGRVYIDHPVIGVGPGMFKYYCQEYGNEGAFRRIEGTRRAHSLFPEVAAEYGTLGLITFSLLLGTVFAGLNRVRKRCEDRQLAGAASAFLLVLVAYVATGIFLHLSYHRFFFLMLAMMGAVVHIANEEMARSREAGIGPAAR